MSSERSSMKEGSPKESRRDFLRKALGAAGVLGFGYTFLWEPTNLEATWTTVPIRDLPPAFEGMVAAVMSDYHFGTGMTQSLAGRAARIAMAARPDLILLPGDFFNANCTGYEKDLIASLAGLKAPLGVFGVLGNHDHWGRVAKVRRVLDDHSPVRLMFNEAVILERGGGALALAATDDLRFGVYRPDLALGGIPPDMPRLFMQHQPDSAEELEPGWRVDLQISGHMHGGQNALFRGIPGFLPSRYGAKFVMGLCQGRSHRVFVTRGLGGLMPGHPRFFCRPEVSFLKLTRLEA